MVGLPPEYLPAAANGHTDPALAGDVDLVEALGADALNGHRPPSLGQVLGGAGKAVEDFGRDSECPLAEILGQVGQIVDQLDAVEEP